MNNEKFKEVKAGIDLKLESAANRLLAPKANETEPVEKVFAHSCGLIGPCGCKKWITLIEAEQLVRLGEAYWLSDIIKGLPNPPRLPTEKMYKAVVYQRGSHSPRAVVIGASHMTNLIFFKKEDSERREWSRRAVSPENSRLVGVIETWPEYENLDFNDDEFLVWANVRPSLIVDATLFDELGHEFGKSADEIKHLFEQAEQKIQKHHRLLIKRKSGIYASWKNMPDDFNLLPAGRMMRTLKVLSMIICIPEFLRLSGDQRSAIRMYVAARLNFRDAAGRAEIPESTFRDRVQAGYAKLGKMRSGKVSSEFRKIQTGLFGCDLESSIRSAQDQEEAMENRHILATSGGSGSRIISRGVRIGAGGQRLQKRLDTYENSEFTIRESDKPREHEASGRKLNCVEDDYDN